MELRDHAANTRNRKKIQQRQTMHDDIADWCDCCSCEAEPQWQEAAEQLGIDLSDRQEPEEAVKPGVIERESS